MKHHDVKLCHCGGQAFATMGDDVSVVMVSQVDQRLLQTMFWSPRYNSNIVYAVRNQRSAKPRSLYLHKLVMPGRERVGHVDRNGLNCMRENLVERTRSQSGGTAKARGEAGYKGVHYRPKINRLKPFIARIGNRHLGYFSDPKRAARVYDIAARRKFGEHARLNFPNG